MKFPVVPVPVIVEPPGEAVTVQVPDAGSPLNATLPVETEHVGWVIVPITGADGFVHAICVQTKEGVRVIEDLVIVNAGDPGVPDQEL